MKRWRLLEKKRLKDQKFIRKMERINNMQDVKNITWIICAIKELNAKFDNI